MSWMRVVDTDTGVKTFTDMGCECGCKEGHPIERDLSGQRYVECHGVRHDLGKPNQSLFEIQVSGLSL